MIADCHMHTSFSYDCEVPMEEHVKQAISLGLPHICFTDHYDMDFPDGTFQLDTPSYRKEVNRIQEKYKDQISIAFGVELGMQTHLAGRIREYTEKYPFDFVIGSMHLVEGQDPYCGEIFKKYGDKETFRRYFVETADNLRQDMDIDTLGHLDYAVRYGNWSEYSYKAYSDEIDAILHILIEKGIALEINTGGLRKTPNTNPHPDVLKRYKELGGELITVGSDSHFTQHVGFAFDKVKDLLLSCGFHHYVVYKQRKPHFMKF